MPPADAGRANAAPPGAAGRVAELPDARVAIGEDASIADAGEDIADAAQPPDAGTVAVLDPSGCGIGSPLDGFWTEVAQLTCFGTEVVPERPIEELAFEIDRGSLVDGYEGAFSVTWSTFETYKDYWGRFTARGAQNGQVDLTLETVSNYTPSDLAAQGRFEQCNDDLIVRGLWLGTARELTPNPFASCGHKFKKQLR
jgi:hypothetical protein